MAPAPAPESTAAAAGRKRKKPHGPSKTLAKKSSDRKSTSGKKKKEERHKHTTHKEKKPRPATGPQAEKPAEPDQTAAGDGGAGGGVLLSAAMPPARQLEFLLRSFERAGKMRLSPLELDSYSEGCMVQLAEGSAQDMESFGDHVKVAFGASWKEELCEGQIVEGEIGMGSPALLVISSAALRSLELLRIKKLIDMEALSLSRLKLVVLDMQKDAKSFNLFTLPQVSNEFWDLYKGYLEPKVQEGNTRICFYGAVSERDVTKALPPAE
ncbi:hypothetical protein BAE44_0022219 [Dichanthelium oligosanthes]|uniref:Protein CMSS1 n=1 Tax=Dichanthelium oligosanthes TaxID=888268 RepID=A0A1E5UV43_9POAL|nr:hypothetical protein BAE44_0022219 [Dichanthelium oligosanthes]